MKKIFQNIAILLLLCSVFSLNVAAADFKTGELITEENQVQIEGLEKNILSALKYQWRFNNQFIRQKA